MHHAAGGGLKSFTLAASDVDAVARDATVLIHRARTTP